MGIGLGTDGSGLKEVLVNSYEGTGVSCRNIGNLLSVTSHHDNGTLNILDPKLGLLSGLVVGSHDAYLLSSGNLSREYTSKGVETSFIGGRNHLRDVHTKRSSIGGITCTDGSGGSIIKRSLVKGINTVSLGLSGGRQMKHNHLKDGISSRKPLLHDTLKKLLSDKLLLISLKLNSDGLQHLLNLSVLLVHDSLEKSSDRRGDELTEGTLEGTTAVRGGPHLLPCIEIPISPKLRLHLLLRNSELGSVSLGETLKCKSPLVKTRSKGNGSNYGVNLTISKGLVVVHGNNYVDGLNGTAEGLVKLLGRKLKLQKSTINFVHHKNGFDTLIDRLTKYSLGLYTDSINGIYNNKGSISYTKSGSYLRREINVTR
mmetsp:Transcript_5679/g.8408  ORF Transcript_5679/g.8408 Transcript_5679/m.8408 type:complete len:371 (-) Transcript_5679:431-1543(-)